jgi:hypothetical protein
MRRHAATRAQLSRVGTNPVLPETTIRWQASSEACGFGRDVTYHLTVTSAT